MSEANDRSGNEKIEQGQATDQAAVQTSESIEALVAERDRLSRENASLSDQLLRKRAEFDNFRKRMERERQDFYQHAAMDFVRSLLPVLDGLERALAAEPAERGKDEFHTGIQYITRQLLDTLAKFGLQPIDTHGHKFDPHFHQAVERVETTEHDDQSILEEWQRGYLFKGRLLRPAMVKVAVRPESQ